MMADDPIPTPPLEPIVIPDPEGNFEPGLEQATDVSKKRVIEFLRFIFSRDRLYPYTDDDLTTGIVITDVFATKGETREPKPKIVVRRDNVVLTNRSLGHFMEWTWSKNFGSRYMDLLVSNVVVECYSRLGVEAERIASKVFTAVLFYRKQLRTVGMIHDILSVGIGAEQNVRVTSEVELAMVPVQLNFSFPLVWINEEIGEVEFKGVIPVVNIR